MKARIGATAFCQDGRASMRSSRRDVGRGGAVDAGASR